MEICHLCTFATERTSQTDMARLEVVQNQLRLRDDMHSYMCRGSAMEDYTYLDFMLNTYEDGKPAGKWTNARVYYLQNSDKADQCRVVKAPGHETMPNFIGTWFPRNNNADCKEMYCAMMLAMFSPWRTFLEIKRGHPTFEARFDEFRDTAALETLRKLENVQYFHQCSDGSRRKRAQALSGGSKPVRHEPVDRVSDEEEGMASDSNTDAEDRLCEDDVKKARECRIPARELLHGQTALAIAGDKGIFAEVEMEANQKCMVQARKATFQEMEQYLEWDEIISAISKTNPTLSPVDERLEIPKSVSPLIENETLPSVEPHTTVNNFTLDYLNEEQNRAYKIVTSHLHAYLQGKSPPQLLMTVIGPGGTGKSTLINALTAVFEENGMRDSLAITATSGVAASLIGGTTLHWWGGLPWKKIPTGDWTSNGSAALKQRRKNNILNKLWLVTDEISMLTTPTTALASEVATKVRSDNAPFGGLNVIFVGDFHQFPPPGKSASCLYANETSHTTAAIGKAIYLQFETVVILSQQMRITDSAWLGILQRSRDGTCTIDDLSEIRRLVLTNPRCDIPDFSKPPWSDAVLVTPRHGVRLLWNVAAVEKHSQRSGNMIYVSNAEDGRGRERQPLTLKERIMAAKMSEKRTARLPEQIELCVGMKAMVTWNLATEADLANGAHGEIVDIMLDP